MREEPTGRSIFRGWFLVGTIGAVAVLGGAWLVEAEPHGTRDSASQYGIWVLARPDSDARLLGITPAQEPAWNEFKNARHALERLPAEEMPASGVKDAVEERPVPSPAARTYAEAAQRLRAVLTPEQRQRFDEIVLPDRHRPGRTWRQLALSLMYILKPS
jgi:hypothetical protein